MIMTNAMKHYRASAFSLVELAIVLGLIGLIVGGVIVGEGMLRTAALQHISSERDLYVSSIKQFESKYGMLPGDMIGAGEIWGYADTSNGGVCGNILHDAGTGTQTCDGNGDNIILGKFFGSGLPQSAHGETFRAWQHLQNAEMIPTKLTGIAGDKYTGGAGTTVAPEGAASAVAGENVPASKVDSEVGWTITWGAMGDTPPNDERFAPAAVGNYNHMLVVGETHAIEDRINYDPFLTPIEMEAIDVKLDDGNPALGDVLPTVFATCTTAGNASDTAAQYNIANETQVCGIIFRNVLER